MTEAKIIRLEALRLAVDAMRCGSVRPEALIDAAQKNYDFLVGTAKPKRAARRK